MPFKNSLFARCTLCLLVASSALTAIPRLRIGPSAAIALYAAPGENAPAQYLTATNIGDGQLNLSVTSTAPWLKPELLTQSCVLFAPCRQEIKVRAETANMADGDTTTGFVIVTDPGAADAPQSISVTVSVRAVLPDRLQFYVKPNGEPRTWSYTRYFGGYVIGVSKPPEFGTTLDLKVISSQIETFQSTTYTVGVLAKPETPPGDYDAELKAESFNESRLIPVGIRVSDRDPIAVSKKSVSFYVAAGFAPQRQSIALEPAGTPVSVLGVEGNVDGDTPWLSASAESDRFIAVVADPTNLEPGTYAGRLIVLTDAANDSITIPVTLEVAPRNQPALISSVTSARLPGWRILAPGVLAAIRGQLLSSGVAPTKVVFNGRQVPHRISPETGDVLFQIPNEAIPGYDVNGGNFVRIDREEATPGPLFPVPVAFESPQLLWAQTTEGATVSRPYEVLTSVEANQSVELIAEGFHPASTVSAQVSIIAPQGVYPVAILSAGELPGSEGLFRISFKVPSALAGAGRTLLICNPGGSLPLNIR